MFINNLDKHQGSNESQMVDGGGLARNIAACN